MCVQGRCSSCDGSCFGARRILGGLVREVLTAEAAAATDLDLDIIQKKKPQGPAEKEFL